MDMQQLAAGAKGNAAPPGEDNDAKMLAMMTQMRDMMDQMIQMMGPHEQMDQEEQQSAGQLAGFASVDQG